MLEEDFRVLRVSSVAGVWIHHQLGVGQVLPQEKGVDRDDDDVFVSMHDKGSLPDVPQHGVSVLRGRGTPFADRVQLSARCPTGCAGKIRLVESRKIAKEKSENSDAMRTL
jgi:hypothetical protein